MALTPNAAYRLGTGRPGQTLRHPLALTNGLVVIDTFTAPNALQNFNLLV
jgi:hypothetical protein